MDKIEAVDLLNVIIDNHKTLLKENYESVKSNNNIRIEIKVHELKELDFKMMILDELKEYVRRHLK